MTDGAWVSLDGLARQSVERTAAATSRAAHASVEVGSPEPYAYGIETGRHRSGGLARRAGGALYLAKALQDMIAYAPGVLGPALLDGPEAVDDALRRIAEYGVARARSYVPVVSGRLQGSITENVRL